MKIYRISQKIVENPEDKLYTDIGHNGIGDMDESDAKRDLMWRMVGGTIEVKDAGYGQSHFREWEGMSFDDWRGRYDKKTNELSIAKPWGFHRDVPNIIMKKLLYKFPNAKKVSVFG